MKRWILLAILGLTMSCVAGAVLAVTQLQGSLSIHVLPVYPGAANLQVQDWGTSSSGSQSQGGAVTVWQSGGGQGSGSATFFIQSMYKRTPGGGSMNFSTNDSPQQVYAFYDNRLGRAGWTSGSTGGGMFAPSFAPSIARRPGNSSGRTSRTYMYGTSGSTSLPWLGFLASIHATTIVNVFQMGGDNQVSVVLFKW